MQIKIAFITSTARDVSAGIFCLLTPQGTTKKQKQVPKTYATQSAHTGKWNDRDANCRMDNLRIAGSLQHLYFFLDHYSSSRVTSSLHNKRSFCIVKCYSSLELTASRTRDNLAPKLNKYLHNNFLFCSNILYPWHFPHQSEPNADKHCKQ